MRQFLRCKALWFFPVAAVYQRLFSRQKPVLDYQFIPRYTPESSKSFEADCNCELKLVAGALLAVKPSGGWKAKIVKLMWCAVVEANNPDASKPDYLLCAVVR